MCDVRRVNVNKGDRFRYKHQFCQSKILSKQFEFLCLKFEGWHRFKYLFCFSFQILFILPKPLLCQSTINGALETDDFDKSTCSLSRELSKRSNNMIHILPLVMWLTFGNR